MKKLLVFHPIIAPYRIDFFNSLSKTFVTKICLYQRNLYTQVFNYSQIEKQFEFQPVFFNKKLRIGCRTISLEFWTQIRKFNPDIILTAEYSMSTIMVLLYKFLFRETFKVVSICDDSYDMLSSKKEHSIIHRIARKFLTSFVDDLILVEPKVVKWYQDKYNKGFFFPIIRKEDKLLEKYTKLRDQADKCISRNNLEGKYVFLFVGRLVELKNVDMLIRSFAKLDQSKCLLVIIGDGICKDKLNKLSKSLDANCFFTGRLEGDELYKWYNVANCFILPSYLEAFGAVTNEALIAGCWCIISNKAGSQCLIKNGINGFTFDPYNENDLSEKLLSSYKYFNDSSYKVERKSRMLISFDECFNQCAARLNE